MIPTARTALLAALTLVGGAAIAQTSANPPAEAILFKNVKVFNGVDDQRTDLDVLVVGNRIHKVEVDIPETGTWAVKPGTGDATRVSAPAGGDYSGGYRFLVQSESGETETVDVKAGIRV